MAESASIILSSMQIIAVSAIQIRESVMRANSLKQHRKHNLGIKQRDIVAMTGISLPRISAFECGNRIPREHELTMTAAYRCSRAVLTALSRGEEIEISNYPVDGRDHWTFTSEPGGNANGNGISDQTAGVGSGVRGSARVDGTGIGHDAGGSRGHGGVASIPHQRGGVRTSSAEKTVGAVAACTEA